MKMASSMAPKLMLGNRWFSCCEVLGKVKSSGDWMARHLKDPYVKQAQRDNYRARSAYKLLEIQERYGLVRPGQAIVECGAAPGAWTQVLVNIQGGDGCIISCDLLPFEPVSGATILPYTDFTEPSSQQRILEQLGSKKIDLVLSDMSPNLSGQKRCDQEAMRSLQYSLFRFCLLHSAPEAHLLTKIFSGPDLPRITADLERFYRKVSHVKPASSRKESAELYLLAQGFKGIKDNHS